jgi:hypothetical protein
MSQTRHFLACDREVERAEHWIEHHGPCIEDQDPVIEWRFRSGAVGTVVLVACLSCGQFLDVTSYEDW